MWDWYPKAICEATNSCGLVYDREGFGQSGNHVPPRDIDFLHQGATELEKLINSVVDPGRKLILYGHSEGGSIALIYAARNPDRISGIVTEAAHCFVEECTIKGIQEAKRPFEEGKLDGLEKYQGEKFRELFWAWYNIWVNPKFKDWNILKEIKKINCPALFMHGLTDQYGSTRQLEELQKHFGGDCETVEIESCGHLPFKEQTTFVQSKATEFINGV